MWLVWITMGWWKVMASSDGNMASCGTHDANREESRLVAVFLVILKQWIGDHRNKKVKRKQSKVFVIAFWPCSFQEYWFGVSWVSEEQTCVKFDPKRPKAAINSIQRRHHFIIYIKRKSFRRCLISQFVTCDFCSGLIFLLLNVPWGLL